MTDVEPPRSLLITFFFNVHRRFRSGHFHGFQRIQIFSPLNLCLPIWIIYFGEYPPKWRIITLLGFSGIYGKVETIKFLAIWIWIPEILSNWQKRNRYFGSTKLSDSEYGPHPSSSTFGNTEYTRSMVFYGRILEKRG